MAFARRPLVIVEDHIDHIDQLLDLLLRQQPELLARLTVLCLDRAGPDTQAAVDRWASSFPEVRVVADIVPTDPQRQQALPAAALEQGPAYARTVASLLAPRGVLLQDIQLETLRFVPADQWWETIYLANTVRGMYAERPPQCIFMSNKRSFHATFGGDLLAVGFDPRDVLQKNELEDPLVPLLVRRLHDAFPLELERSDRECTEWLTSDDEDAKRVNDELDLVLCEERSAALVLSGRAVKNGRVELASDTHEADTWRALVESHLEGGPGIPTHALGKRLASKALRAEQINKAARHIYDLKRKHLKDASKALLNVDHYYCLADDLRVGRVRRRPRSRVFGGNASES